MADYLTLILTASFFASVISTLVKDKGAGKSARVVISLIMLSVIILPIVNGLKNFSSNIEIPVINENYSHIIDNKDNEMKIYREWLAKTTATQLSSDMELSIKNGIGIEVRVECPWHFEGENVVFDKVKIYTATDERYYEKIINYVKLHYSLDSECFEEV